MQWSTCLSILLRFTCIYFHPWVFFEENFKSLYNWVDIYFVKLSIKFKFSYKSFKMALVECILVKPLSFLNQKNQPSKITEATLRKFGNKRYVSLNEIIKFDKEQVIVIFTKIIVNLLINVDL